MRNITWFGACASAVLLLGISASQAQTTPDQARDIATALKRYIEARILEPNPDLSLDLDGQIEVTPVDDHYAGSIPPGRLLIDTQDGSTVTLTFADPLAFDLRTTERGWYDVVFTVPSSVRIGVFPGLSPGEVDAGSAPAITATATIGSQVGTALLIPEYEAVMDYEIVWSDLAMQFDDEPINLQIGRITAIQTGEEVSDGVVDNTANFDMANLALSIVEEDVLVELDTLTANMSASGVNLPAQFDFLISAEPVIRRLEAEPDNPDHYGQLRELLANTPNLIDSLGGTYDLKGFRVISPDLTVDLPELAGGFAISGLNTDYADISGSFNLSGLDIQPEIPFHALIPVDAGYDFEITDLSTDVLLDWLDNLLATIPALGVDVAIPASLFTLYEDLAGTGALLDIRDFHIETQSAGLNFNGRVRPDTAAMFGATVEADLAATALSRLTETINGLPEAGAQMAAGLAVIQAFGAREVNDEGDTVHRYQFEVTRDGMVMLNGNDLGPIVDQIR